MKIRNTAGTVCIKNICMTEGSACTGIRALKRRFTGSNMRAGRNTLLFRKRDGMAFGAADPFLEGRRIGPCSAASGAEAQKRLQSGGASGIGNRKTVRDPGGEQLADSDKNTVPQKLLNGQERRNNLKKAFKAGQNDVKLNAIVIIDDIYTTGSTIDAMAAVCRQQGVSRIYFAALSIGNGQEVR